MTNGLSLGSFQTILNNLWIIIFILIFLVPQLQRSRLNSTRRKLLRKIAKMRNATTITLIHRQEIIAFFGIPLRRYIDIDDSEEVLRAIRAADPNTPIELIIHTPGGIALAATQIALALKDHPAPTRVIVPHYAMSGGCLIALAADEICMDPHAVMGPFDPQLGDQQGIYPASSLLKIIEAKHINRVDDRTLVLAEEAKKALRQTEEFVRMLVSDKFDKERVDKILEELASGKYTHDYPLTASAIKDLLGECVQKEIPPEIYTLMRLYRMEYKPKRPGVEFVPVVRE
ncbi:MAG: ATP-dependent Clp protease proteolytic subunit [Candidatus Hodarchaeota archaeon]